MKGICASSWTITKNHCMMLGQQNVKFCDILCSFVRTFCVVHTVQQGVDKWNTCTLYIHSYVRYPMQTTQRQKWPIVCQEKGEQKVTEPCFLNS